LIISNGSYELYNSGAVVSSGTVTESGADLTFKPASGKPSFTASVNGGVPDFGGSAITTDSGTTLAIPSLTAVSISDLQGTWLHNKGQGRLTVDGNKWEDQHQTDDGSWAYYSKGIIYFNGIEITFEVTGQTDTGDSAQVGTVLPITLAGDKRSFSLDPPHSETFTKQ
jgi:hypothetical protein